MPRRSLKDLKPPERSSQGLYPTEPTGRKSPKSDAQQQQPPASAMTEEIQYYEEELNELMNEVEEGIGRLRKIKDGHARLERVGELNLRLQRARQTLQSFRVEMRELPREQVAEYDARAEGFKLGIQQMSADLQVARQEAERSGLGVRPVEEMATSEIIGEAHKVQDKSLASVARMQRQVADTKQVGAETAETLKAQTEQLQRVDVDIMKAPPP